MKHFELTRAAAVAASEVLADWPAWLSARPAARKDSRPRPLVLIEAPSNLGLKPPKPGKEPGTRHLPEALARAGLSEKLGAKWRTRVEPPPYSEAIDPKTDIRNAPAIARYSIDLAKSIGEAIDMGAFPLVLGGDCSILLGNLVALRRRGRYGLFFLDGHADFATPETSLSHGAAGMDLALATGRGPEELANLAGLRPLVLEEDVVLVGFRDEETLPEKVAAYRVEKLRSVGVVQAVRREIAVLRLRGVRGFWIHVDADVLDPSVMPAVDSPEPNGLTLLELTAILEELLASDLAVGMHVGIYDPDLDGDGRYARGLVEAVAAAFERAGRGTAPRNTPIR
ncbi:MAG TPA: arginase family protein [Thermoanaerobaculia bacterium]|jgi:arginase